MAAFVVFTGLLFLAFACGSALPAKLALLLTALLVSLALFVSAALTSSELVVLLLAYGGIWIVLAGLGMCFGLGTAVRNSRLKRRAEVAQKRMFRMMNDN